MNMPPLIDLLVFLIGINVLAVEALKCWSCDNAASIGECKRNGRSITCNLGQICATEVRYHGGWLNNPRITKQCKQALACRNNEQQNPSECNKNIPNAVCRCCCERTKNCNKVSNCPENQANAKCDNIPIPIYGNKRCNSNGNEVGTRCVFTCRRGFQRTGGRVSVCKMIGSRAKYRPPVPTCSPIKSNNRKSDTPTSRSSNLCSHPPPKPFGGTVSCIYGADQTGIDQYVCHYSCPRGQTIIGSPIRRCAKTGINKGWDGSSPKCIVARCQYFPLPPVFGDVSCTGGGEVGTNCTFHCDRGYMLIGSNTTVCVKNPRKARWDRPNPSCKEDKNMP